MSNLVTARRVTIVTDALLEKMILEQIVRLGAKGYTCTGCRGRGEHEVFEDPFTGSTRVRIETIVQPDVAAAIMDAVHAPSLLNQPLTACVETVEVSPLDQF